MKDMENEKNIQLSADKNSRFYQSHKNELEGLREFYRKTLTDVIMPFWDSRVLDSEQGGYFNCFDRTGKLYSDLKPGWFLGRNIYNYSLLYNELEKNPEWLRIAGEGVSYLTQKAYLENGRFAQMMKRDGQVINGAASIFTDHFAVKGLYEYIAASGNKELIPYARVLGDWLFCNINKREILEKEGIKEGTKKHAINFLTLLVALESRRLFGDTYEGILEDCVQQTLYEFSNDEHKAVFEYVREDGTPYLKDEGRIIDPGHGLEALWFCMKAGIELGRRDWIQRASEVVDWLIDRCYDEEFGGFLQETDVDGYPSDRGKYTLYYDIKVPWDAKIWWVQAEALIALGLSALLTENERHYDYFIRMHKYIEEFFHDKEYGEWYSYLNRDGIILSDRKGTVLKGPYHVPRCMLMTYRHISSYLE